MTPASERSSVQAATCPRCQMAVTRRTPRVVTSFDTYHRECYEAWHFARTGRYPRLRALQSGPDARREFRPAAQPVA